MWIQLHCYLSIFDQRKGFSDLNLGQNGECLVSLSEKNDLKIQVSCMEKFPLHNFEESIL